MKNPPAFLVLIVDRPKELIQYNGMTLRDYFAAKAMQAYCSGPDWRLDCDPEDTAIAAYEMADEMLKARSA